MDLLKNTIQIGLEKPLKILQVTDSHIAFADEFDNERKHELLKECIRLIRKNILPSTSPMQRKSPSCNTQRRGIAAHS